MMNDNSQFSNKFQIAAQEAQRAAFYVERAIQEKQEKIVQARGEAEAAKLVRVFTFFLKKIFFENQSWSYSFGMIFVFYVLSLINITITFLFQLGDAITKNPGYLKLRKIRAAQQISKTVSFRVYKTFTTPDSYVVSKIKKSSRYQVIKSRRWRMSCKLYFRNFLGLNWKLKFLL